ELPFGLRRGEGGQDEVALARVAVQEHGEGREEDRDRWRAVAPRDVQQRARGVGRGVERRSLRRAAGPGRRSRRLEANTLRGAGELGLPEGRAVLLELRRVGREEDRARIVDDAGEEPIERRDELRALVGVQGVARPLDRKDEVVAALARR